MKRKFSIGDEVINLSYDEHSFDRGTVTGINRHGYQLDFCFNKHLGIESFEFPFEHEDRYELVVEPKFQINDVILDGENVLSIFDVRLHRQEYGVRHYPGGIGSGLYIKFKDQDSLKLLIRNGERQCPKQTCCCCCPCCPLNKK